MSPLEVFGVFALGLLGLFATLVLIACIGAPLADAAAKRWQADIQAKADERRALREQHDAYLTALGEAEDRMQSCRCVVLPLTEAEQASEEQIQAEAELVIDEAAAITYGAAR